MNRSDCLAAIPPPRFFSLWEARLSPRPGSLKFRDEPLHDPPWPTTPACRVRLAFTADRDADFQLNDALVPCHIHYFGATAFTSVRADHTPSLGLRIIRYLLIRQVPFWPGGYPLARLVCPTDSSQLTLTHRSLWQSPLSCPSYPVYPVNPVKNY